MAVVATDPAVARPNVDLDSVSNSCRRLGLELPAARAASRRLAACMIGGRVTAGTGSSSTASRARDGYRVRARERIRETVVALDASRDTRAKLVWGERLLQHWPGLVVDCAAGHHDNRQLWPALEDRRPHGGSAHVRVPPSVRELHGGAVRASRDPRSNCHHWKRRRRSRAAFGAVTTVCELREPPSRSVHRGEARTRRRRRARLAGGRESNKEGAASSWKLRRQRAALHSSLVCA